MQTAKISFDQVLQFSDRDKKYQLDPESFSEYISYLPTKDQLIQAAKDRKKYPVDRKLLVDVLHKHYDKIDLSTKQKNNIDLLSDPDTFTVVTAHQPSFLTGPLYYVSKIFSTVNLAQNLNDNNDGLKFVPVFINGSEDHDFEEIASLNIFNKKVSWQSNLSGAVGRMSTQGLETAIEEFSNILGESERAGEIKQKISDCLSGCNTYNDFVFKLVNAFFGDTGILVLTMDDALIKRAFLPIMKKEVFEQASIGLVLESQEKIENQFGYKAQAFARPINLFYLGEQSRNRIEKTANGFEIVDSNIHFSPTEMEDELNNHPERFSPNVVTRPLFEECILPNVAYVGGGGELAYWLERKSQFEAFGVFFPALVRRNSLMIITKSMNQAIAKTGFDIHSIFKSEEVLIKEFLNKNSDGELDLSTELKNIDAQIEVIATKAETIDPTLKSAVMAEGAKIAKQIEHLEAKIRRSLKQKEEVHLNQIKNVKSKLFPGNGLQERTDNYFQFFMSMGDDLNKILEDNLNPLQKEFIILIEE